MGVAFAPETRIMSIEASRAGDSTEFTTGVGIKLEGFSWWGIRASPLDGFSSRRFPSTSMGAGDRSSAPGEEATGAGSPSMRADMAAFGIVTLSGACWEAIPSTLH
jgi:hypothetical protein